MKPIKTGSNYRYVLEQIEKREEFLCLIVNVCRVHSPTGDVCGIVSSGSETTCNTQASESSSNTQSIVDVFSSKILTWGTATLVAVGGLSYGLFKLIRKKK